MSGRDKPEDALPGLTMDEFLHPVWSKPDHLDGSEPEHIKACYWTLWSKMQPFDGRPNSEFVARFGQNVWTLLALESAYKDPWWLVGQIVYYRMLIEKQAPAAQVAAIQRITIALIDTIVEST